MKINTWVFSLVTFVLIMSSCSKDSISFELTDEQLLSLVEDLQSMSSSERNYHVFYAESFNSNVGIIKVYKSAIGHIKELDNKSQFDYSDGKVYVYSSFPTVKDSDKLEGVKLPYFIPDGTSWELLIRSNSKDFIYEKVSSVDFSYRKQQIDDDENIF